MKSISYACSNLTDLIDLLLRPWLQTASAFTNVLVEILDGLRHKALGFRLGIDHFVERAPVCHLILIELESGLLPEGSCESQDVCSGLLEVFHLEDDRVLGEVGELADQETALFLNGDVLEDLAENALLVALPLFLLFQLLLLVLVPELVTSCPKACSRWGNS